MGAAPYRHSGCGCLAFRLDGNASPLRSTRLQSEDTQPALPRPRNPRDAGSSNAGAISSLGFARQTQARKRERPMTVSRVPLSRFLAASTTRRPRLSRQEGQALIEYALIISLIAL